MVNDDKWNPLRYHKVRFLCQLVHEAARSAKFIELFRWHLTKKQKVFLKNISLTFSITCAQRRFPTSMSEGFGGIVSAEDSKSIWDSEIKKKIFKKIFWDKGTDFGIRALFSVEIQNRMLCLKIAFFYCRRLENVGHFARLVTKTNYTKIIIVNSFTTIFATVIIVYLRKLRESLGDLFCSRK